MRVCLVALLFAIVRGNTLEKDVDRHLAKYSIVDIVENWKLDESSYAYIHSVSFNLHGDNVTIPLTRRSGPFHPEYRSTIEGKEGLETPGGEEPIQLYSGLGVDALLTRLSEGSFIGVFRYKGEDYIIDPSSFFTEIQSNRSIVYRSDWLKRSLPQLSNVSYAPSDDRVTPVKSPFLHFTRKARRAVSPARIRCPVQVVADHFFFNTVAHKNPSVASRYIAGLIDRVNSIFTNTDWGVDDKGFPLKNLGLSIKRISLLSEPSTSQNDYNSKSDKFIQFGSERPWDISNLLKSFSKLDTRFSPNEFCLRILLSARSVTTPVRGEAYVANESKSGGICANVIYEGYKYNTLIVNVFDGSEKRLLITREVDLIFAHEMGHAWGAHHDDDYSRKDCLPSYDEGGKFIMHQHVMSGYDDNNSKFSKCSLDSVSSILSERRETCFVAETVSSCGNGLVEEGEECDEGGLYRDGAVVCCTDECTLIPQAQCSPLNDPCCTAKCGYQPKGYQCLQESPAHCTSSSHCTGKSSNCPRPASLPDRTSCIEGGQCFNGTCMSFCEQLGKKSCMCAEPELSCHRCCSVVDEGSPSKCLPQSNAPHLPDGARCYHGHCSNSTCIRESLDLYSMVLSQLSDRSSFFAFLKSNIVAIVIISTSPLFCIGCYLINKVDQERSQQALLRRQMSCNNLHRTHPRSVATPSGIFGMTVNNDDYTALPQGPRHD